MQIFRDPPSARIRAKLMIVKGLVQGIGFRPFIYRAAAHLGLKGWVENRSDAVYIKLQGPMPVINAFLETWSAAAPPLARIESQKILDVDIEPGLHDFSIRESRDLSQEVTEISPDLAVCDDCLQDMRSQSHRIDYPFVNCTHCGPRFSILQDLPYDRDKTTMADFAMCDLCRKEYDDIKDRRFHAQPIACNHCGPHYELLWKGTHLVHFSEIIRIIAGLLVQGQIAAVKGLGGFHLVCDALNERAVQTLRQRKQRDQKPFAVMLPDLATAAKYAEVNAAEAEILLSRARPIVLLKVRQPWRHEALNHGLHTLGVMLPYLPIHHRLFEASGLEVLVYTSGNQSDEPIVKDNDCTGRLYPDLADVLVLHNRRIHNRADDSLVRIVNHTPLLLRRSRGYVPQPVNLPFSVNGILALGAELKNCFAYGKGRQAVLSQHIGDLQSGETYAFYEESIERFRDLLRLTPELVVCDLHPDYLSTRYALETGLPLMQTQHHHSHIAACLAEHHLLQPVIGVSFDGAGLGDDGTVWGAEFLVCDLRQYTRIAYFQPVPLPGGDRAAREPWRMALSFLFQIHGESCIQMGLPFQSGIDPEKQKWVMTMLSKGINLVQTSSAGRLFDAIAALLDLCLLNSFEAEAALKLEACLDESITDCYACGPGPVIPTADIIRGVLRDMQLRKPVPEISAKFHNTLGRIIAETCAALRREHGLSTVVISGGTFQNAFLLRRTVNLLQKNQFQVFWNQKVPCNDGGLALGQLAIAAQRRS